MMDKSPDEWIKLGDDRIRHVWVNSQGKEFTVSPDFYQDNGTPMDPDLDEDLTYSHTEIKIG